MIWRAGLCWYCGPAQRGCPLPDASAGRARWLRLGWAPSRWPGSRQRVSRHNRGIEDAALRRLCGCSFYAGFKELVMRRDGPASRKLVPAPYKVARVFNGASQSSGNAMASLFFLSRGRIIRARWKNLRPAAQRSLFDRRRLIGLHRLDIQTEPPGNLPVRTARRS